ncbi:hypothetical protein GGU11DRAFT_750618 [Lentinula aff. detonsa]|nr:hypothetical protein GGU11DRAFT_750618 [Lentinula aff. detonsa]
MPALPATRTSRLDSIITPNTLRPNVQAKDRIHAWNTPYSVAKRQYISEELTPEILELGDKAMYGGLANSTKSSYAAGILRFNQFCDVMNIPETLRMPACEDLITGFIGFHLGKVSGASIKGWLSGLRAWHDLHGAPWPSDSRKVRLARAGSRIAGAHHKRPIRNPITLAHLLAIYFALNFNVSFDCAVWAVACNAFWGCRRLGELTVPSKSGFDLRYHVARNTSISFSLHPNKTPKSVNFRIPWTKTTKELGASVTGVAQQDELNVLCPFMAMKRHLKINNNLPDQFSLFGYTDESGKPQHMVKSTFLAFCDSIWKGKGLLYVQGHSFRIGGAVELLIAKVPPEIVAAIGGWTSLAFLIYWRRFEEILPAHILKAYKPDQISRLKSVLDDYRKTHKIPNSLIDSCINGIDTNDFE